MVGSTHAAEPDDAYERLQAAIVSGRLPPSERLVEEELVERLGLPRASVRTALLRLAHEGLVERERNRGAHVRRVDEREAVEILEARAVLESLAAGEAAARATADDVVELRAILAEMGERLDAGELIGASERNDVLHRRILEISRHRTANRLVSSLNSQLVRFQFRTMLLPGRAAHSLAEHGVIVEAIAAGDPQVAEAAMREHLTHVTEALRAVPSTTAGA